MKTVKIGRAVAVALLVAVALSALPAATQAALSVFRNGVLWDATYEGTAHPGSETPTWAGFGGGGPASGSSDGDIWTQTTVDFSFLTFEQTDATWTGAGSARSVEFRAQVTAQTASDRAFDVLATDASGHWDVQLRNDGVGLAGSVFIGSFVPVDNSIFHTYRLVYDNTLSFNKAVLYLDGIPIVSSGGNTPGGSFGDLLAFGDRSTGGIGGATALDFISWTAGAEHFVPEPSVAALLAVGALAVMRRRHRA